VACGAAIAPYGLRWYEEPLDPLDYLLHAALTSRYRCVKSVVSGGTARLRKVQVCGNHARVEVAFRGEVIS
jgi:L-alanine-DL-glutamate epimerase-like enolase superfamily enzyme